MAFGDSLQLKVSWSFEVVGLRLTGYICSVIINLSSDLCPYIGFRIKINASFIRERHQFAINFVELVLCLLESS